MPKCLEILAEKYLILSLKLNFMFVLPLLKLVWTNSIAKSQNSSAWIFNVSNMTRNNQKQLFALENF